jgi:hypothetical protein
MLSHDEFSILSDHLNLTYIYNTLSADPTLARHVVHKLKRWTLKMSVFSNRMEHLMGELKDRTDFMMRLRVGWIADSEHKAYAKMASVFASRTLPHPTMIRLSFCQRRSILWRRRAPSSSTRESSIEGYRSSRSTAAAIRCWWHKDDKYCTIY